MPPHVGVYVIVAVGAVAVGLALKTFVYDPFIAPTIEQWKEEILAREQERRSRAGRRRAAPFSTFHRDSPKDPDAGSTREEAGNLDVEMESLRRGATATGVAVASGEARRRTGILNSQEAARDSYASSSDATRVPDMPDAYRSPRSSIVSRNSRTSSTLRSQSSAHSSRGGPGVEPSSGLSQVHGQQSSSGVLASPPLPPLPPSISLDADGGTAPKQLLTPTSEVRHSLPLGYASGSGSRTSLAGTFKSAVSRQSQYPGRSSQLTVNNPVQEEDRDILQAQLSSRSQHRTTSPTSFSYSRSFDAYTAPEAFESAHSLMSDSPRSELLSLYESDVGSSPFDRDEMMSPAMRASQHLDQVPARMAHPDLEDLNFAIGNISTDSDGDDNILERRSLRSATNFSTAASSISFGDEDLDVRSVSSAGLSDQSRHSYVEPIGHAGDGGRGSVSGMESDTLFEYHDEGSDDGSYGSWDEVRGSTRSLR